MKAKKSCSDTAAEARYRVTLASIGDGVISTDAQGRIDFMNPVAERLTGWNEAEAKGRPIAEVFKIVNEETRAQVENPVARVLREGVVLGLANHTVLVAKDRTERPIADSGAPIRNEKGEVTGVVLVFRDQTEERAAQKALRESEIRNRTIVASIPQSLFLKDRNCAYLAVNKPYAASIGSTPEQVVGKDDFAFYPAELAEKYRADDRAVMESGRVKDIEERYLAQGKEYWVHTIKAPVVDDAGEVTAMLGLFEDITERKRVEDSLKDARDRLEEAQQAARLGNWEWDAVKDEITGSEEFYRLFDVTPDGLTQFSRFIERLHPDDRERVQQDVADALKQDRPYDTDYRVKLRDGGWRDINARGRVFTGADGKPVRMVGTCLDITERKRAEEALRARESMFRAAVEILPVGLWILDAEGKIAVSSAAAQQIWGGVRYVGLGQLGTYKGWRTDNGKSVKANEWAGARAFSKGEITVEEEVEIECFDGTHKIILDSAAPFRRSDGSICGAITINQDITKRKRTEELLRSSEKKYRLLHETMMDGFVSVAMDGAIQECNEVYRAMLGYSESELGELTYVALTPEKWHAYEGDIVERQVMKRGYSDVYEKEYRRKDGTIFPVELRTVLSRDEDGNPNGMWAISRDITERKRAEESLLKSERKYRLLHESLMDAFASVDMAGRILEFNRVFKDMLGYSEEEIYRLTYSEITPARWHASEAQIIAEQVLKRGYSDVYEKEYRRKDGTIVPVELRAYLIRDEAGAPMSMWAIVRDITERKRAEEGLRDQAALLDSANDAIIVRTMDQRVVYWNAGAERLYGWKGAEVMGRRMDEWERTPVPEFEAAQTALFKEGHWSGELERTNKAGRRLTVFCRFTLLQDEQGQPSRYLDINTDITEKKQLETQFLQSQKLESVGRLAAGVAHDFNNLLTVILGCSSILLEELPPGDMHSDVEQIKKAGEQAVSLTRQLLAFSRKQIFQPINLDLNELISETGKMLAPLLGEDIDLLTIPGPRLGLIKADPGQVQQVIVNLAVNARDAMPKGGKLTIETNNTSIDQHFILRHPVARAGSFIMLAISDNGIGMDEETQAHIFEPFFTTKGLGRGTGLGLSTVYGIVKQSDGFIWVYSELGKGTTFKIYFPSVGGQAEEIDRGEVVEIGLNGSETVLVAEDESAVRAFTVRSLRKNGFTVLEASDGQEALRIAQEFAGEIQLVITDVVMPNMSGNELISRIQVVRPGIKAIYVSGYTDDAIAPHGILDSGIAFLPKPFTAKGLARKVREVIASRTL